MARPRKFDRDLALRAGLDVFWRQGFAATTTDDLRIAMGIGRQSFYAAFSDKKRCYLEALRLYAGDEVSAYLVTLRGAGSPLEGLHALLAGPAKFTSGRRAAGCMALNAVTEFGAGDADVTAAIGPAALVLRQGILGLLRDARTQGEVPGTLDEEQATSAILCTRSGLLMGAKAGLPPVALRQVADFIVEQLRH